MADLNFKALVLERPNGRVHATLRQERVSSLPAGDVQVAVEYSSVNYKDALIIAERSYGELVYPLVPGIDLAGSVISSTVPEFVPGDRVVLNGAGAGEKRWGGYAERASVEADSLVMLPARFSTQDAMFIGTAGFAAALSVSALETQGVVAGAGPVLVTGAAGGLGSIAVALLAARGHEVIASSGATESHERLRKLGAVTTVGRITGAASPPLGASEWAGAIDAVGGAELPLVLGRMRYGGVVAAVGFVAGLEVPLHLAPFLIRSTRLVGINTSLCPRDQRQAAWNLLDESLDLDSLQSSREVIGLPEVPEAAERLLRGEVHGRVIVRI